MQALMDMKDNTKMIVDIRGYSCPISLAMIAKTFNTINTGQNVEILSDDETIHKDIEQW
ncbi:MAG: sulfurtransferase TusA family protein, partial [Spirochaetes bacterium]|nr:sulfurtransferase TusA family protein [Spirochaetota bacterium]